MKFEKHVFVCTNQRINGKECCGEAHGLELVAAFKKLIKEKGLAGTMRAQKTGCFDCCAKGPIVMIYPEGTCYGHVGLDDVQEIFQEHLLKGEPVERLKV